MVIAVTDSMGSEHKFQQYIEWLMRGNPPLDWIKLSYRLDNLSSLDACDGIIFTGGGDVDPILYNGPRNHPKIHGVDIKRDDFERRVIDKALQLKVPLLGICRGLQLVNVHFGGTLVPDIEEAGYSSHESEEGQQSRHNITTMKQSFLFKITGKERGIVSSSHHQSVATVGRDLKVVTRASDGIVEAVEFEHQPEEQFFMMIQWHPERMSDIENPYSKNVLQELLAASGKYHSTSSSTGETNRGS